MNELQFTSSTTESIVRNVQSYSKTKFRNEIQLICFYENDSPPNKTSLIWYRLTIQLKCNSTHLIRNEFELNLEILQTRFFAFNRNISLDEWRLNGMFHTYRLKTVWWLSVCVCVLAVVQLKSTFPKWPNRCYLPVAVSIITKEQFRSTYFFSFFPARYNHRFRTLHISRK